ncbi:MAG TPA: YicC family protein [Flavobacteriaceae bacterium]|nr:YicC family protein [Flavobacteriaceae bacterium]
MVYSMTGFGKSVLTLPGKKITIEVKSLNSKGLDLSARIPSSLREKELLMRDRLAKALKRGKIDLSVYVESTGDERSAQLNTPVIQAYMEQLQTLAEGPEIERLQMALRLPESIQTERDTIDQETTEALLHGIDQAVIALEEFRAAEGGVLAEDFRTRINLIRQLLDQVTQQDKNRIPQVRARLLKAVQELEQNVDQNRFEQELVYYLEKYDITEETVRLSNHLDYFLSTMKSEESNGKKLGFITQEIGREINTIGSKANDAVLQQLVVQMKDELEKIKEQVLNVL